MNLSINGGFTSFKLSVSIRLAMAILAQVLIGLVMLVGRVKEDKSLEVMP